MSCINHTKLAVAALVAAALVAGATFAGTASPPCENCPPAVTPASAVKHKVPVFAVVNGVAITLDDFNQEVRLLSPMQKARVATPTGRRQLVEGLVTRELAAQQAAKEGFDKTKEFKAQREYWKKSFLAHEYMTKKVDLATPLTDAEIRSYYEQNIAKYQGAGERIRASNLMVKTEDEAKAILAQLKAGASFEDLARQKSIDATSVAKGGDTGWWVRGTLGEPFDKAVAELKAGEISDVIKARRGFHIVKVTEIRAPGTRQLDEVAPSIIEETAAGQQTKASQKVTKELRNNAKVVIKEDALAAMGGRDIPEPEMKIIPADQTDEQPELDKAPPKQAAEPPKQ